MARVLKIEISLDSDSNDSLSNQVKIEAVDPKKVEWFMEEISGKDLLEFVRSPVRRKWPYE